MVTKAKIDNDDAGGSNVSTADLREQVATVGRDLHKLAQQVGGLASGKFEAAKSSLGDVYEAGKERLVGVEESVANRIRSRPLTSILIALGVGGLLGLLARRR